MEIEQVGSDKIVREYIDPAFGLHGFQARAVAFSLGFAGRQAAAFADILMKLYGLFEAECLDMIEVNPLAET